MTQAEGASLWGVSLALHEGATFVDGQVSQRNLDAYTPLRMADAQVSRLESEIAKSKGKLSNKN